MTTTTTTTTTPLRRQTPPPNPHLPSHDESTNLSAKAPHFREHLLGSSEWKRKKGPLELDFALIVEEGDVGGRGCAFVLVQVRQRLLSEKRYVGVAFIRHAWTQFVAEFEHERVGVDNELLAEHPEPMTLRRHNGGFLKLDQVAILVGRAAARDGGTCAGVGPEWWAS